MTDLALIAVVAWLSSQSAPWARAVAIVGVVGLAVDGHWATLCASLAAGWAIRLLREARDQARRDARTLVRLSAAQ